MKDKNLKYDLGKKIGSVTLMPAFMLGIQGFLDSLKGEKAIPDARIEGMKNKCMAIEKKEALIIEKRYESVRKEAVGARSAFLGNLNDVCSPSVKDGDGSPYAIRSKARAEAVRAGKKAEAEQAKIRLLEIRESLVHADIVLKERIGRTREKALNVKIAAYIKGVRKGKIPDYNPDLGLTDDAYSIYVDKHKNGDDEIFSIAEKIIQKEN